MFFSDFIILLLDTTWVTLNEAVFSSITLSFNPLSFYLAFLRWLYYGYLLCLTSRIADSKKKNNNSQMECAEQSKAQIFGSQVFFADIILNNGHVSYEPIKQCSSTYMKESNRFPFKEL